MITAQVEFSLNIKNKDRQRERIVVFPFPMEKPIPKRNDVINYGERRGVVTRVIYRYKTKDSPEIVILAKETCDEPLF